MRTPHLYARIYAFFGFAYIRVYAYAPTQLLFTSPQTEDSISKSYFQKRTARSTSNVRTVENVRSRVFILTGSHRRTPTQIEIPITFYRCTCRLKKKVGSLHILISHIFHHNLRSGKPNWSCSSHSQSTA